MAVDGVEHCFDTWPELRDCSIDRGAALLLRSQPVALLALPALHGDVLVRRHPAAVRHGTVGDFVDASVAQIDCMINRLASGNSGEDVGHIGVRITLECTDPDALLENFA